jgi:hypothetical protein
VRPAALLAAVLAAGGVAATAGAQTTVLPNLNGKWTLSNERSSVWTVKQVGDEVTASRRGAPGHPNLVSSFRGFLYDFGPYAVVQGLLTNTGEGAAVTSQMCWTIRSIARPTEFQWGDCQTQVGKFLRAATTGAGAGSAPSRTNTKPRTNASPHFTNYGPVLRG